MNRFFKDLRSKIYFDKKTCIFSAVFGFLIGLSFVLGGQIEKYSMTLPGFSGKLKIFAFSLLLAVPIGLVSYFLFLFFTNIELNKKCTVKPVRVFLISFIAIVLTRIPVLLAYYPAVMSYDFGRQYSEAMAGYGYYFDYQPLIHTALIRVFYLIGLKLNSIEAGMALLSILQIVVTSLILAYSVSVIVRITGLLWTGIAITVIYALLPLHTLISVIMTKDVFFSAFFVLFICLLYERMQKETAFIDIAIVVTAILNITFRKNSVYAMVFLVLGFLVYEKGIRKKLVSVALMVVCIAAGRLTNSALVTGLGAHPANSTEMYSVPMVQFMRTYVNQGGNFTERQNAILYYVLPLEIDGLSYNPYFADTVKSFSGYRPDVWQGSPGGFLSDWIEIGKAYPNEYLDAFLCLNKGYWYLPDRVFAEVLGVGAETGKGVLHTYNCTAGLGDNIINEHCYLPGVRKFFEVTINENGFFKWPVINILFRPAFYFWGMIFAAFVAILRKNRSGFVFLTYPMFYMLTLLFGPLVYIRYMYPEILALPLIIALVLDKNGLRGSNEKD